MQTFWSVAGSATAQQFHLAATRETPKKNIDIKPGANKVIHIKPGGCRYFGKSPEAPQRNLPRCDARNFKRNQLQIKPGARRGANIYRSARCEQERNISRLCKLPLVNAANIPANRSVHLHWSQAFLSDNIPVKNAIHRYVFVRAQVRSKSLLVVQAGNGVLWDANN